MKKEKINKIGNYESTRDYLRYIVKILCDRLEINNIDPYKLNSKEDCINCIVNMIKTYNSKEDCKALRKEIDALKEEIEVLTNSNFNLTIKNNMLNKEQKDNKNEINTLENALRFYKTEYGFFRDEIFNLKKKFKETKVDKFLNYSLITTCISIVSFIAFVVYKLA